MCHMTPFPPLKKNPRWRPKLANFWFHCHLIAYHPYCLWHRDGLPIFYSFHAMGPLKLGFSAILTQNSSISRKWLKIFPSRFHHWIRHGKIPENDVSDDPFSSILENPRWRPKLANFSFHCHLIAYHPYCLWHRDGLTIFYSFHAMAQ